MNQLSNHAEQSSPNSMVLAALGVVYGDIGTSPLYTIRECFINGGATTTRDDIFGVLSLIFWALMIVVTIKYVIFVMRADNHGEGGILALTALTLRAGKITSRQRSLLIITGLIGAALFYGDGMITPAISVLSALEGLDIATPIFSPYVVPIAIIILLGLFLIQQRGTAQVGALFGPIMALWFFIISVLGIWSIWQAPEVIFSLDPRYGISYFIRNGSNGWLILGAIVLALTGAEALYADMGHFSRHSIRMAWFFLVLPALILNYFGQGALLLREPHLLDNPFYHLVPKWGLYPLVILATVATIIASQAVISGAYSLTKEAIQLEFIPRMRICHTSFATHGQIYLPLVNWSLAFAVILLVAGFASSDKLAAAYGIAVTGTMISTTLLIAVVARHLWKWPWIIIFVTISLALIIDLSFFGVNLLKFVEGGWFPLLVGFLMYLFMNTWKKGRARLIAQLAPQSIPVDIFLDSLALDPPLRVPGTAIFMTGRSEGIPRALLHNLQHNHVLHQQVVLLTVLMEEIPLINNTERITIEQIRPDFKRITVRYGFAEMPNIPKALDLCHNYGIKFNPMSTSYFLSRETIIPTFSSDLWWWQEYLFATMNRNAGSITDFLRLPTNRVVELGAQVEL